MYKGLVTFVSERKSPSTQGPRRKGGDPTRVTFSSLEVQVSRRVSDETFTLFLRCLEM